MERAGVCESVNAMSVCECIDAIPWHLMENTHIVEPHFVNDSVCVVIGFTLLSK